MGKMGKKGISIQTIIKKQKAKEILKDHLEVFLDVDSYDDQGDIL